MPENGIQVAIGPDMRNDLDKIAIQHCKDPSNMQKCMDEINRRFQVSSLDRHAKRFVLSPVGMFGLWFPAVIVAGVAVVIAEAIYLSNENTRLAPELVKFDDLGDNGVLGQLNRFTDVETIAIATGTDNKVMATITIPGIPTPTHKPESYVTIEDITTDNGEYKKGDIVIHLPQDPGDRFLDYLRVLGLERIKNACNPNTPQNGVPPQGSPGSCTSEIEALTGTGVAFLQQGALDSFFPADLTTVQSALNAAVHEGQALIPNMEIEGAFVVPAVAREQ